MNFSDLFLLFAIGLLLLSLVDAVRFARRWRSGTWDRRDRVFGLISIAASVNFFSFMVIDLLLGGDALNGRIEGTHYYLGSHGTYTEVSHGVFLYSACHAALAVVGIAAIVVLGRRWKWATRATAQK